MLSRIAAVFGALALFASLALGQSTLIHTLDTRSLQEGGQLEITIRAGIGSITAAPLNPAPAGRRFQLTATLIATGYDSGYDTATYDCTRLTQGQVTTNAHLRFGINVFLSPSSWSQIDIPGSRPTIVACAF